MAFAAVKRVFAKARRFAQPWLDRLRGIRRVHMLDIGKTGGAAVKTALAGVSVAAFRIVLHRHGVALHHVPAGQQCFFFVRDPVARFLSGFLSRQREGRPRHNAPWGAREREAFASFATPNELALALSSPDPRRRQAAETAMNGINHVRDHYRRWFGDEAYLSQRRADILFVGAQERFDTDVVALSGLLGVKIRVPRDDLRSHRTPAHAARHLDPEAIANLRRWYSDDYSYLRLLRHWFPHLPDYEGDDGALGRAATSPNAPASAWGEAPRGSPVDATILRFRRPKSRKRNMVRTGATELGEER
jgi:hypothetical protein